MNGIPRTLIVHALLIAVAAPAVAPLAAANHENAVPVVCDHLVHRVLGLASPQQDVTRQFRVSGWHLQDLGAFRVDAANPTLRVAGVSQGDPFARFMVVVANGVVVAGNPINHPGGGFEEDPDCPKVPMGIVVAGAFTVTRSLAGVLAADPLAQATGLVDVQVGLTTFVGAWAVTASTQPT